MRKRRWAHTLSVVLALWSFAAVSDPDDLRILHVPGGVYSGSMEALPYYTNDEEFTLWTIVTPRPAIGDLNGDGSNDLVLPVVDAEQTNGGEVTIVSGSLILCFNDGTGAFTEYQTLAEPDVYPLDIALADMNGDGHLDVIGLRLTQSALIIWLGDGEGGFEVGTESPVDGGYFALDVADVNDDGTLDVVVFFDYAPGVPLIREIHVFPGVGDGTLGEAITTALPEDHILMLGKPWRVQIADFTGDGHLDVALVGTTYAGGSGIIVAQGDGSGRFDAGLDSTGFDFYAHHTAAGDFDGDGTIDMAISHIFDGEEMRAHPDSYEESSYATVLFGGDRFLTETSDIDLGVRAIVIRANDLNGDERCDLIAFGQYGVSAVTLSGPARAFHAALLHSYGGGSAWTGFVDDFNGDGLPDIGGQFLDSGLNLSFGDGSGGFGPGWLSPPEMSLVPSFGEFAQFAEDLDRDGNLDLVCIDSVDPGVAYGDGSGRFPRYVPLPVEPKSIRAAGAADFNHDGWVDLLLGGVTSDGVSPLRLVLNHGAAGLIPVPIHLDQLVSRVSDLAVADLDGDGDIEAIVSGSPSGLWLIGDLPTGSGEAVQMTSLVESKDRERFSRLRIVDLDGDNVLDLVYVTSVGVRSETVLLMGSGDGTFTEVERILGTLYVIADLDMDGTLDISTSKGEYLGRGRFEYAQVELGRDVYSAFDLDADGSPELISAFGRTLLMSRGRPEGGWMLRTDFAVTDGKRRILETTPVYGDFDGDARTDLAFCTERGISVLLNRMEVNGE